MANLREQMTQGPQDGKVDIVMTNSSFAKPGIAAVKLYRCTSQFTMLNAILLFLLKASSVCVVRSPCHIYIGPPATV